MTARERVRLVALVRQLHWVAGKLEAMPGAPVEGGHGRRQLHDARDECQVRMDRIARGEPVDGRPDLRIVR